MAEFVSDSTKLLPCPNPWCASHHRPETREAYAPYVKLFTGGYYRVLCAVCPQIGPSAPDADEAIAAWNTRVAPPAMDREAAREAQFLLDRLEEFEREITGDGVFTQFNGHVSPSAARLRMCLSTLSADAIRQGEGVAQFGAEMFQIIWDQFADAGYEIEIHDLIAVSAVKAGLVRVTKFDPEVHTDSGAAEPGDKFYEVTAAGRTALATPASHASDGGEA